MTLTPPKEVLFNRPVHARNRSVRLTPRGNPMSTLAMFVVLLLMVLASVIVGGAVFAVHRYPTLRPAITTGLAAMGTIAAVLAAGSH